MNIDKLHLTVTCPTCKAAVGAACTYKGKHRDRDTHCTRQDRAMRVYNRAKYGPS